MSDVSFMEKLLDGKSVKWQPLQSIAKIKHGKDWKGLSSGEIPVYGSGGVMGYVGECSYDKPTVLIPRKGSITNIFYVEKPFWNVDTIYYTEIDTRKMVPKFLYYFIKTIDLMALDTGSGRPSLTQAILNQIQVPIPCPEDPEKSLEIQTELVRILDAFTSLTAELTAELTARKKQYNYYRDKLLSFEEGEVEWKALGEIGTWYGGGTPSKSHAEYWENGTIPWISPKDMGRPIIDSTEDYITEDAVKNSSTKLVPANSIAIVVRSSILEKILPSALVPLPASLNQDMKAVIPHSGFLPRYIAHMIRSRGDDILRAARKTGGSVASIDSKKLFAFKIPVPHPDKQRRIVKTPNKSITKTTQITKAFPREIELRQKQYEYYRDLLLSFPKPEADAAVST